jgi:hypothetical protein
MDFLFDTFRNLLDSTRFVNQIPIPDSGHPGDSIDSGFIEEAKEVHEVKEVEIQNDDDSANQLNANLNETQLAQMVAPLCTDICFFPDAKKANCSGLFRCMPGTHRWQQIHNTSVEKVLCQRFEKLASKPENRITPRILKHLLSRRGRANMVHLVAAEVTDVDFEKKCDANRDILPFSDGRALDFSQVQGQSKPFFREITRDNYVTQTTGWAYDPELAKKHRPDVEDFLEKILPVPEERYVVLTMFAHFLCGRRWIKKILLFTDRRAGNNGKSALLALMRKFLGGYSVSKTNFVIKGSFQKNRNAHDAGLQSFKTKRLVVAEELTGDMTLDVGLLKRLTSADDSLITGRKIGESNEFSFIWQAGIVLSFNEGDCPAFDAADAAFMGRLIVVPMRSKFVSERAEESDYFTVNDEFTYSLDPSMCRNYGAWCSSLADILIEHYKSEEETLRIIDSMPAEMRAWRAEIAQESNLVAEWLRANLEVTGNGADHVLCSDLKALYYNTAPGGVARSTRPKDWVRLARGGMERLPGAVFKAETTIAGRSVRNVISGVRLRARGVA